MIARYFLDGKRVSRELLLRRLGRDLFANCYSDARQKAWANNGGEYSYSVLDGHCMTIRFKVLTYIG